MATAETIITRAENITKIDRLTIGVPGLEETELLRVLNDANDEYLQAFLKGGGEYPVNVVSEHGDSIISSTAVNDATGVATTDTTLTVDASSGFDSAGALAIWDDDTPDILEYTSHASNVFSGVTGINYAHDDNDVVTQLYALPSNFGSLRSSPGNPDGVTVDETPYTYTEGIPLGFEFRIYDNGASKYLLFPKDLSSGDVFVQYNKNSTTIDDTSDTIDVPDNQQSNQRFHVYKVAEHIFSVLGRDNDELKYREKAREVLMNALKVRNIGKKVRLGRKINTRRVFVR